MLNCVRNFVIRKYKIELIYKKKMEKYYTAGRWYVICSSGSQTSLVRRFGWLVRWSIIERKQYLKHNWSQIQCDVLPGQCLMHETTTKTIYIGWIGTHYRLTIIFESVSGRLIYNFIFFLYILSKYVVKMIFIQHVCIWKYILLLLNINRSYTCRMEHLLSRSISCFMSSVLFICFT